MAVDIRSEAAGLHDLNTVAPNDLDFYLDRSPYPETINLELGSDTGSVLILLSNGCFIPIGHRYASCYEVHAASANSSTPEYHPRKSGSKWGISQNWIWGEGGKWL